MVEERSGVRGFTHRCAKTRVGTFTVLWAKLEAVKTELRRASLPRHDARTVRPSSYAS